MLEQFANAQQNYYSVKKTTKFNYLHKAFRS